MPSVCLHALTTRVVTRECRRRGNALKGAKHGCRRYATSKQTPPPPKQQRAAPKPLPFKPAQPKATPNPNPKTNPITRPSPSSSSSSSSSSPSSSSRGYEDERRPISELLKHRWFPLFGAGAMAMCVGLFSVSLITYWRTHPAEHWTPGQEPETPTGRPSIQSPREFDQHLDKSEWRYGITKVRRRIASEMARGHVLEVAVGAGRNFDYYDWSAVIQGLEPAEEKKAGWFSWLSKEEGDEKEKKEDEKEKAQAKGEGEKPKPAKPSPRPQLKTKPQPQKEHAILSFTGVDISPSMLDLALTRIRQVVPFMADQVPKKPSFTKLASKTDSGEESISLANNRIRIFKADAQAPFPPPPSPGVQKYDTVIQTFGLCSVRDPVRLLSNMAAAVKPETGRIILLEHGRSWWELINGFLDRSAREHFDRFGCWWNRDIELVVRAAERAVPGLEVLSLERPGWATMGTHLLIEMRVRGDSTPAPTAETGSREEKKDEAQKSTGGWWSSLLSVNNDKPKTKKDD
ncbi:hypothetical protein F5Y06DRAFT_226891 [Hypoxylon sp. FL0890]|nr:hypothetical protein F5Y06DRAFT_226891 [Hypoxylon sp. FL0890]